MANSKRTKALLASLEQQGAEVVEKSNGWFVKFPDGSSCTIHSTESDHRAELNTRARVKRAGLVWPFDPKPKKK